MPDTTPSPDEPRRGRPRDPHRDEAIIAATVDVLVADGYDNLTIDRVAQAAGCGKATVYRRWSSKADLVVDAVKSLKPAIDSIDSGTLEGDLQRLLEVSCSSKSQRTTQVMVSICSALPREPELLEAFQKRSIEPRIQRITAILERARERGELPDHVDIPMAASLVPSLLLQRALFTGQPAGRDYAEQVVHSVLLPVLGRSAFAPAATPSETT